MQQIYCWLNLKTLQRGDEFKSFIWINFGSPSHSPKTERHALFKPQTPDLGANGRYPLCILLICLKNRLRLVHTKWKKNICWSFKKEHHPYSLGAISILRNTRGGEGVWRKKIFLYCSSMTHDFLKPNMGGVWRKNYFYIAQVWHTIFWNQT